MIIFYNILQFLLIITIGPLVLLACLFIPKYRNKIIQQLGFNIVVPAPADKGSKRIWIHALSVGEVTSAVPLIKGLKEKYPESKFFFSATTKTGLNTAKILLPQQVDGFFYSPLDILPVLAIFCSKIKPDLYIHVETDFWPNRLFYFRRKNIPAILVNGRISEKSFESYSRFPAMFHLLFSSFNALIMQTDNDVQRMLSLGVGSNKVAALGNLKYDVQLSQPHSLEPHPLDSLFSDNSTHIVAGSTHPGEEEIILKAFKAVKEEMPDIGLRITIAPRDIGRCVQVMNIAANLELSSTLRSADIEIDADVLLLDTLGELAYSYRFATLGIVGGSFINFGGHNPIEPASFGIPVLYGPHMLDFHEICNDLEKSGGSQKISTVQELTDTLLLLLSDTTECQNRGDQAKKFIKNQQGVVAEHIKLIDDFLC